MAETTQVTVFLAGVLRSNVGGTARLEVHADGVVTLGAILDRLADRHPLLDRRLRDEHGVLRRYVNFYLDGEECRRLAGADTVLRTGSEIQVIPSVAGG